MMTAMQDLICIHSQAPFHIYPSTDGGRLEHPQAQSRTEVNLKQKQFITAHSKREANLYPGSYQSQNWFLVAFICNSMNFRLHISKNILAINEEFLCSAIQYISPEALTSTQKNQGL